MSKKSFRDSTNLLRSQSGRSYAPTSRGSDNVEVSEAARLQSVRSVTSKILRRFLYLFSLVLLFTSCGGQDTSGTQLTGQRQILIAGADALQPFISTIAPLFEKQHTQIKARVKGGGNSIESIANFQVQGGGSVTGLEAMEQQKADITMTDIYADPVTYSSPNLSDQIVVVIPYTLIVNPGLTPAIHSLTSQQIIDIFAHHVQNWQQLGGPDVPIVPISEADNIERQGNTNFFQAIVLGNHPEIGKPVDEDSIPDVVAHTPGAIGYSPVPLVTGKDVRQIAIDELMATANNIESNHYHFWVYGHLYTVKGNDSSISSFLNFAVSSNAQQIAQKLGYVPLASMKLFML